MECGNKGHIKCTKERKSLKIQIDTHVQNNLDEFIESSKKKYSNKIDQDRSVRFSFDYADDLDEHQSSWLKDNTNILVPEQAG